MQSCAARLRMVFVLAFTLAAVSGGTAWAVAPAVEFRASEVSVTGVSPGGRVVLWWLAHGVEGYVRWTSRLAEIAVDEDGDGAVVVALERGVPERSLWAVVDLASGEYALASPLEGPLREVEPPRGLAGALAGRGPLEEERRRIEVLVVRPGEGPEAEAWTAGLDDGGPGDGDGERNGRARVRLERLAPVEKGGGPPPLALRSGDVVVAGNAEELVFWAHRLAADPAANPSGGEEVSP